MKRKEFLRKIGLGAIGVVVAPRALAEMPLKENNDMHPTGMLSMEGLDDIKPIIDRAHGLNTDDCDHLYMTSGVCMYCGNVE